MGIGIVVALLVLVIAFIGYRSVKPPARLLQPATVSTALAGPISAAQAAAKKYASTTAPLHSTASQIISLGFAAVLQDASAKGVSTPVAVSSAAVGAAQSALKLGAETLDSGAQAYYSTIASWSVSTPLPSILEAGMNATALEANAGSAIGNIQGSLATFNSYLSTWQSAYQASHKAPSEEVQSLQSAYTSAISSLTAQLKNSVQPALNLAVSAGKQLGSAALSPGA